MSAVEEPGMPPGAWKMRIGEGPQGPGHQSMELVQVMGQQMTRCFQPVGHRPLPVPAHWLALLVAAAPLAAAPLSLEEALGSALATHERAAIAAQGTRAARARVNQAWSVLLPSLRLDLGRSEFARSEGAASGTQNYEDWELRVGADQLLFDAQALPLVAQARHAGQAAEADEGAERLALAHETAGAFLEAFSLHEVERAAAERLSLAKRSLEEIRSRHEGGLVGSNDLTRAELEMANAERALVRARGDAHSGRLRLSALTGSGQLDSLAAPQSLLDRSAQRPGPLDGQTVLQQRPDVRVLREQAAAARAYAAEPWARWVPDLSVGLDSWTDQSEDFSAADAHWSWALNLGWSLFDGGLRLSQQAERRAMARAADLRTEWAERQVALDLALATTALESAQAGLARAEVARQAARRNAEESAELYRQGLVRALEVTDAAVQLFEAEVEHTKAQVGQAQAWLQLQARQGLGPVEGEFPEERR